MRTIAAAFAALMLASCSTGTTTTDDTDGGDSTTIAATTTLPTATTTAAAAPTTTTSTTSTSTSTTTSTLPPMEAAQVAYFVISAEYNEKMGAAGVAWGDSIIPWAEYGEWCTPRGAIAEKFATDIADYRWPKEARDEAALLVST